MNKATNKVTEILLMAAFCLAIAVLITLLGVAADFLSNLTVACAIGFSISGIHLLRPLFDRILSARLSAVIATFLGLVLGLLIGGLLIVGEPFFFFSNQFNALLLTLFFGVVGFAIFGSRERAMKARQALVESEVARVLQEKKTVEAQVRILQSQIEPHFLFNTLSNIVGMIQAQRLPRKCC